MCMYKTSWLHSLLTITFYALIHCWRTYALTWAYSLFNAKLSFLFGCSPRAYLMWLHANGIKSIKRGKKPRWWANYSIFWGGEGVGGKWSIAIKSKNMTINSFLYHKTTYKCKKIKKNLLVRYRHMIALLRCKKMDRKTLSSAPCQNK